MRYAIFFAVARNAKVQIRIAQFRRTAGRAFVKWFGLAAGVDLETSAPRRNFPALSCFMKDFTAEKDQIIAQRCHQRHAIGICPDEKTVEQKCRHRPGDPLDLYRQNKKYVDNHIRVKAGEGVKERRNQHTVGKISAEEKRRNRGADHPDEKIKSEPKRTPRSFEAVADEPEKPQDENDPQKAERLRDKNVSDESPDFAVANARWIEIEHGNKIRLQAHEDKDERIEPDNDANQPRDSEKTEAPFEFIQPSHVRRTVEERGQASRWIGRFAVDAIKCKMQLCRQFFSIKQGTARSTFDTPIAKSSLAA